VNIAWGPQESATGSGSCATAATAVTAITVGVGGSRSPITLALPVRVHMAICSWLAVSTFQPGPALGMQRP
jgi:cobalamin biosynthesis protein CbiD